MAILAQCGYGRSDKIETGITDEVIHGVILSPRDERRAKLEDSVREWAQAYPNKKILFDPQFYAATLNTPKDGHLNEYEYYSENNGLGRTRFSQTLIQKYVRDCIKYQIGLQGLSYLIAPNVGFEGFRDNWSQVSINMAVESYDYYEKTDKERPMLVSQIFSENALRDRIAMEEYLGVLTELDVDGFYVIINRNASILTHSMDPLVFANLIYFCYILAFNGYKVVVGYSDWFSFILEAVGVNYTACGWYQNLRQFSMDRFHPRVGGRRPNKRYSSSKLLNCPLLSPELQSIYVIDMLNDVLSGSKYDKLLIDGPASGSHNWTDPISCYSHWFSLSILSDMVTKSGPVIDNLKEVIKVINSAESLYERLGYNNIYIDSSHIEDWKKAIKEFCELVNLELQLNE